MLACWAISQVLAAATQAAGKANAPTPHALPACHLLRMCKKLGLVKSRALHARQLAAAGGLAVLWLPLLLSSGKGPQHSTARLKKGRLTTCAAQQQ